MKRKPSTSIAKDKVFGKFIKQPVDCSITNQCYHCKSKKFLVAYGRENIQIMCSNCGMRGPTDISIIGAIRKWNDIT